MKEYRMSEPVLLKTLKKIYGSIGSISGKKVLVIRDLKTALLMAVRNSVVYVTDDPECAELFRKNTEAGMGNDDIVVLINKWTNKLKFTKVFEKMGMKFDVAIMNPPYDRNLHLKILEAVIPHAEKVVNISPVRWLQDPFAPFLTRSDYCKFENGISKHIKDLEVIPAKNATELFQEASFTMNLGIYTCDEQGGYNYTHNDPLITKIVEKTMQNSWSNYSMQAFYRNGGIVNKPFVLNVSGIHSKDAKYPLFNDTYAAQCAFIPKAHQIPHYISGKTKGACHFEFNTDSERLNFYNCYNHPFMIWHTKLWKEDANIRDYKVPYFDYYDHAWDYEDFFNWFGLTQEERVRVMNEIAEMQAEKAA